jgi:hypothetical protein
VTEVIDSGVTEHWSTGLFMLRATIAALSGRYDAAAADIATADGLTSDAGCSP